MVFQAHCVKHTHDCTMFSQDHRVFIRTCLVHFERKECVYIIFSFDALVTEPFLQDKINQIILKLH